MAIEDYAYLVLYVENDQEILNSYEFKSVITDERKTLIEYTATETFKKDKRISHKAILIR